jgi:hypothetical protein
MSKIVFIGLLIRCRRRRLFNRKPTAVSGDGFVRSESGHYPTEATSGMRQAHHQV